MSYAHTKSRVLQYIGIILMIAVFAGAYWYFKVYAGYKTSVSPTGSITSGLVGYWTFDGADVSGTTATDRGSGGNNGTLANDPGRVGGQVGQALDFFPSGSDTNARMSIADPVDGDLDFGSGDFAVGFWSKGVGYSNQSSSINVLLSKKNNDSGGAAGYVFFYDSTNTLVFRLGNGTTDYSISAPRATVNDGVWHHYVGFRSGSTTYLYIDGVLVGSTSVSGSISNSIDFVIGSDDVSANGNVRNANAKIDEVRVYNRILSTTEIESLYRLGQSDEVNTGASQAQGTGRLDSGLAGYWKMDDGTSGATPTTATDSSTNGNTLTLNSGPTWTTGQIGNAVNFDGSDDSATVGSGSTSVALTTDLSLSAWIYLDTTPSNGVMYEIMFKNSSGDASYLYRFSVYNNGSGSFLRFTPGGGGNHNESSTALTSGQWYHVMVTFDQPTLKFYLNGKLDTTASDSVGGGFASGSGTFRVGGAATAYFDGSIDEARIYNRALSADEVAQLYRLNTPTAVDTGLKGYWSFNGQDVSGTTAYDRSGAGNTGTLTNGPTVTPGKLGQALSFDGSDDSVDVTNITYTGEVTLSTWFYTTNNSQTTTIFGDNNGSSAGGQKVGIASGNFFVRAVSAGSSDSSVAVPTAGQWHHLVMTRNSSNKVDLYVDGGPAIRLFSDVAQSGTNTLDKIGCNGADSSACFSGKLDETRIYNRALAATEIESLYKLGQSDEVNTGASQAQGGSRLDSGLAGYWKLDDGSGTSATDASTNGNTGTLTNGPTWTTGQIGSAVDFDGTDDYVTTADISSIEGVSQVTFSAWVNADTLSARRGVIGKEYQSYTMETEWTTGDDVLIYFGSNSNYAYTTSDILATGQWQLWTMVFDGSQTGNVNRLKFYLNGVQRTLTFSSTIGSTSPSGTNAIRIGDSYDSGGSRYLDGKIDEVRIYTRALSADEVADLYRLTTPTGTETGLKGYWSFNGKDVSGTTAYDRSGAGNTGTLTNGPAVTPGKLGQGLNFDGVNDSVTSVANSSALAALTQGSFAFWIKPRGASYQGGIFRSIVNDGGGNGPFSQGFEISGDAWQGTQTIRFAADGSTGDMMARSTTTLSLNTWTHVVVIWDGTLTAANVKFYQNGVLDTTTAQTNGSGSYVASDGSFLFGGAVDNKYLDAILDEVRVYNRTLTEAEIKALYNASR